MGSEKRAYQLFVIGALIVGSFFVGVARGRSDARQMNASATLENRDLGKPQGADFSLFWKAWALLDEKHVSTNKVSDQGKLYGAIKGLAESYGDPYTVFFPPQESKMFQSEISGAFEGVGMEVGMKDNILTVIAPLKGSPSERAGMKTGDKILQINGTSTQNVGVDEAVNYIRGKKGTVVTFLVLREGVQQPFEVKVTRDTIDIPTIDTEVKNGVYIIRLYSFSANSATLFRNALRGFLMSGTNKLVLDLRGNPGGYLEAAVDMASWFLPAGKVVVSEDFNGKAEPFFYKSKGYNVSIFNKNLKMVILVDKGSASASEILSGALSEYGIAKLVGTQTFGKGSVQELVPLNQETSLKITVAKWLTPKGKSISDGGLKPDVEVTASSPEDFLKGKDAQLEKALEIVNTP